ncbi:sensory rhodopsin transducer [Cytophagaceae bacterium ABcell3]|nr:sensory rhodopsin transducer [Cytophagaceae bacterium ABcell3]
MEYIMGKTHWAIAEGLIPDESTGPEPEMESHETACILNTSDQDAHVEIMIYFKGKDPVGPYKYTVPAKRVEHIRFNNLNDPEPIPRGEDYASTIISDVPIVVQHSRLDSRQSENALMTTMAYAAT